MTYITNVELWKDIGYLEDSVTVPSANTALPDASLSLPDQFAPNTSELFNTLTVPYEYAGLMDMSYIKLKVNWNNADPQIFYGWIDDIEAKSDTEDYPSTVIRWHVDLWRTYINNANITYGLVENRPRSVTDPIQPFSYRYRLPGTPISLRYSGVGQGLQWALITFVNENSDNKVTECRTMVCPVSKDKPAQQFKIGITGSDTEYTCPSLSDIINGRYDERYGLSASSVSSVFMSPYPPFSIASFSDADNKIVFDTTPTGSEEHTSSTSGTMQSYRLTSLNVRVVRVTNFYFSISWTDTNSSTEESVRYSIGNDDAVNWIKARPGARGGTALASTVNETAVDFLMYKRVSDYINENISGIVPSEGATFTIAQGYVSPTNAMTYSIGKSGSTSASRIEEKVEGSQLTSGIVFTYTNGNWVSTQAGEYICFTSAEQGNWTYSTSSSSTEYSVSLAPALTDGFGYAYSSTGHFPQFSQALPSKIKTTETQEYIVTDMTATPIGSVPWGIEIQEYNFRIISSATNAYIEFRFKGIDSHASGLCYTIPLPAVDVTSNSWSDYVYSGSREFDIEQRRIANEQALIGSITSSITGGASSYVMGSLGGSTKETERYGRSSPTARGKLKLMETTKTVTKGMGGPAAYALTAGVGIGASFVQYGLDRIYADKLQKATDIQSAKQIDSIVTPGTGWDWLWNGRECSIIPMLPDQYSIDRYETDITLNGVTVSEPTENIQLSVGPWRIADGIVTGEIPKVAKDYINLRISRGVRII